MKYKKYKFIFFLVFISFCIPIEALDPSQSLKSYKHKTWTYEDGLPQSTISSIAQSSEGYIWFGTGEGIIRFDGMEFEFFNKKISEELTSLEINDLLIDSKGNLWIATSNGIIKYRDGNYEKFTMKEGLTDNNVWDLFEDSNGNLWIGTGGGGISVFNGKTFNNYSTDTGFQSNYIWSIFEDSVGNIWIGTDGNGLIKFDGTGFRQVTELDDFSIEYVFDIVEDSESNLYFATPDGLLIYKDHTFDLLIEEDGISYPVLWRLLCDKDDNIWIGTDGGGLLKYNNEGVENFNSSDGLNTDMISYIFEDSEANIWVATHGGGLTRFKGRLISSLLASRGELSSDLTYAVYEYPEGTIWVGTNYGLNRIKDGKTELFLLDDDVSSLVITSITSDDKGNLWIGTDGYGLNKFSDGNFETITSEDGLSSNSIWALSFDDKQQLWIATHRGGIDVLKDGIIQKVGEELFTSEFVTDFYLDSQNRMWISTIDVGLFYHYDDYFYEVGNLSHIKIRSIYEDSDSTIWIATDDGLGKVIEDSVIIYGEEEGLSHETIYSVLEYSPGDLWISSNKGIFRISKQNIELFDENKIDVIPSVVYGINDGMESVECSEGDPPVLAASNGLLYYPTKRGVAIVDPERVEKTLRTPQTNIESVQVDGVNYDLNSPINLPAGSDRIEINYTAFHFASPIRLRFQYFLEGFDDEWINAGTKRSATFTKLPPGKYTFKVRATLDNEWQNSNIQSITFRKEYFIWETKTFQIIILVTILLLPYGIYRYIINQSRKKNLQLEKVVQQRTASLKSEIEERKRKEAELNDIRNNLVDSLATKDKFFAIISHDLRSPFQGLLGFSELLSDDLDNFTNEEIKSIAGSINKLANNFITQLNNLLEWSRIQRGTLEVEKVKLELKELVDSLILNLQVSCSSKNIKIINKVDKNLMVYSDENILNSTISNLITNAIKFSHKGDEIIIGAEELEDKVEIYVRDFGVGMPEELLQKLFKIDSKVVRHGTSNELGSGLGLVLINDLIRNQGGSLRVESTVGKGTTFYIQLPKMVTD